MADQLPLVEGDTGAQEARPFTLFKDKASGGGPVDFAALEGGGLKASGIAPVSGQFTTTGPSATFTPLAGRDFNVYLAPTANTVQMERQRNGVDWEVVLTSAMVASLPPSFTWSEPQVGVPYRLNVITYSEPQAYGMSQ